MKQELIDVVRDLKQEMLVQDSWIDSLPNEISSAFFDNTLTNSLGVQRDILIKALFGDYEEAVYWFLYEFTVGKFEGPHCIDESGKEWTYNTDEDYFEYLKGV